MEAFTLKYLLTEVIELMWDSSPFPCQTRQHQREGYIVEDYVPTKDN